MIDLNSAETRKICAAWSEIAQINGLSNEPFLVLSQGAELPGAPNLQINQRGHLSSCLTVLPSKKWSRSQESRDVQDWLRALREIEARHFVLCSEKQLNNVKPVKRLGSSVFDLLLHRLVAAEAEFKGEVRRLLDENVLCAGYSLTYDGENPGESAEILFDFNTDILAHYPLLQAELARFEGEARAIIENYEEWLAENNIREYTQAIRNGLLASLPVLVIASLADGLLLPWIRENAIEALTPVRKILESIIRFITGGAATLFIWFNLEKTQRGTSGSQARTVYRAAAIGTLIGPVAVGLGHFLGLSDTAPIYAAIASLAASADNLVGALTQLRLRFAAKAQEHLGSGLTTAVRHPFFVASIGAILSLGLIDGALRLISHGEPFAFLSAMGLEGLIMGVGDTVLIYLVLRILESAKISQLLGRSVR